MDFELTEEQSLLQTAVRDFAEEVIRPRAAAIDQSGEFPRDLFRKAGELGLAGVSVPPEYGGAGMDVVSYSIVIEEISRVCANMGVILSVNNSLVCDPIEKWGNEQQKKAFLGPLARGEKLGCFALTEPDAGSDAANQKTRAVREGDVYRITGQKVFITCGQAADLCILFAMTDLAKKARGISAFIVDAETPGFDRSHHQIKLGVNASGTVEIFLTDVRVPAASRLGQEGDGFKIAMSTLDAWLRSSRLRACSRGAQLPPRTARRRPGAVMVWKLRSPSSTPPRWHSGSRRRRCRSTADMATRRSIRSSATFATPVSPRSTRARARSTG